MKARVQSKARTVMRVLRVSRNSYHSFLATMHENPIAKNMKNQNHSYATPMKPGKKGLNTISDIVKIRGISKSGPILNFMENMALIALEGSPPGLFRTELKTGIMIRE